MTVRARVATTRLPHSSCVAQEHADVAPFSASVVAVGGGVASKDGQSGSHHSANDRSNTILTAAFGIAAGGLLLAGCGTNDAFPNRTTDCCGIAAVVGTAKKTDARYVSTLRATYRYGWKVCHQE
jgi:hypothetical protein